MPQRILNLLKYCGGWRCFRGDVDWGTLIWGTPYVIAVRWGTLGIPETPILKY